jgi:hypothetical protein
MPYKDKAKADACKKAWAAKKGKEYWHNRYLKYHPQVIAKQQDKRLQILQHYSHDQIPRCACCGETQLEFLTIDHRDGGGTLHRETAGRGQRFYGWLIRNGFPDGYQVLCYNCNCSLGHYKYCPHQKKALEA